MALRIYPKDIRGHTYYYARRSWREKLDPGAQGKARGSGKSRMCSETHYLGSAERIVVALNETRQPLEVRHRAFGMVADATSWASTARSYSPTTNACTANRSIRSKKA
ncbi:MAG TPA: hypothetical protein ENN80_10695 [Candidatus Hydrogenedentes bacterium]|nr:hypothetical protein [Candidatus Hydrogenedentota bacterium]